MAFAVADRILEKVAAFGGGTGSIPLPVSPSDPSYQTFLAGWGASGSGWYCLNNGTQWETGLGTLNGAGTSLARTTVFHGSNGAGVAVNFAAGTLVCFGTLPAAKYGTFPNVIITDTTPSTSSTSGALTVAGGVGVGGNISLNGDPTAPLHAATKQYADTKIAKAGDTMTGDLWISTASAPALRLNRTATGPAAVVATNAGLARWELDLGDNSTEAGANAGSNFIVSRYNDGGSLLGTPLSIVRSTGTVLTGPVVAAASAAVHKVGYSNASGQIGISLTTDSDATSYALAFFNAAKSVVGSITTSGVATSYNTSSSAELKEDLKAFDAAAIIEATNVYDFKFKNSSERAFGILAQQAIEVYPQAVTFNEKDDWWGIDYSKYVPILLQELKTLRARVANLENTK